MVIKSESNRSRSLMLLSFLVGVLLTHFFDRYIYFNPMVRFFSDSISHFNTGQPPPSDQPLDPFSQIEKLQKEMMENAWGQSGTAVFGRDFSMGSHLEESSDDNFYYFYLHKKDLEVKDFKSEATEGSIRIQGTLTSNKNGISMQSSMDQTLPLPEDADTAQLDIQDTADRIIIRIPRRK